ncbi:hypothetical protein [Thalassomonas sp. M1454]|uniref:hypothetical protein n=1 Tax=Thalassomonas sp. M1454 TaxID=2594477 RepID=UPI001181219B|nr:hypothetical protein [Thalassomonas sp. M1454]TRX57816.1 hypothetical protein FNN08_00050 [Thalassomonas sp. M1454]
MRYELSFGYINILADNIAEVIVDQGTMMTLEMCEEYDEFLIEYFTEPFAILVNKLHNYSYTFEAKLHIASLENLVAIAVVTYNKEGVAKTKDVVQTRANDGWNLKEFSGLQMGREKALKWLEKELNTIKV